MASPPSRPEAMNPFQATEFASDRYFAKIAQQRQQQLLQQKLQLQQQQQQQQQQQNGGSSASGSLFASSTAQTAQSLFILPLRDASTQGTPQDDSAHVEHKQKRSRFTIGRLLHPKAQHTPVPTLIHLPAAVSDTQLHAAVDTPVHPKPSQPFDILFLRLPAELQIQVIASLPLADILRLRLTSRAWHAMVTANESPIVRFHLKHNIPEYAKRIYPPDYTNLNFRYLCGLWHRLHVAAKLSFFICEWVTKEIFLRVTAAQRQEFAPQRERMRRRLIPLLFTIFHFFETYRTKHLQYIIDHDGKGLRHTPYTMNPIEVEIMNMYDDRTLLQVHQVFPLVVASFCRRLRPPSYVGRVEMSLRGYLKDKPPDEVHTAALCIGGLRQVERFWEINGYNNRRSAVDTWYNSITKLTVEPVAKPRRGLASLGRKRSATTMKDDASATLTAAAAKLSLDGHVSSTNSMDEASWENMDNLVFNTSLAGSMPMGPLSHDQLRLLLPNLPVLQQLWMVTAEALILERKVVDKAADIRRNAQVMLELIREDGFAEEDEWWYGHGAHESVRPPVHSMDEDANDFGLQA